MCLTLTCTYIFINCIDESIKLLIFIYTPFCYLVYNGVGSGEKPELKKLFFTSKFKKKPKTNINLDIIMLDQY